MKRRILLLIVIVFCVALAVWASRFKAKRVVFSALAVPKLGPTAITIVPGIHLLGGLEPAAAYAVETSDGLVLVDSGLESDASRLKADLRALALDWKQIKAVLLTHVHGDHCGGAQYLRATVQAKVYAGRGDAAVLRSGAPREAFFSVFFMPNQEAHSTGVDVELDGGESISFGDTRFLAVATPGHTPGSTCYMLERPDVRALFGGDVITKLRGDEHSHAPEARPLGTYSAYLPPRYRGDAGAYLLSLEKLRSLPVPDLVLPGHPRADIEPQKPALSHQEWSDLLENGVREMQTLLAHYEADGRNFLDGNPKRLLPDLYYLGDFSGAAVYGFFASSRFFLVDAPGGPGLRDFVRSRLVELGLKPADPTAVLLTSCAPEATGGLKELTQQSEVLVAGSASGLDLIKACCPGGTVVIPADDLAKRGWLNLISIPLRGPDSTSTAYLITWSGKPVLVSGRIPFRVTSQTWSERFPQISRSRAAAADFLNSVSRLESSRPALWLPAVPTDGRNANLYGSDWDEIILWDYRAGLAALMQAQ